MLITAGKSDVGRVRDMNQDAFYCQSLDGGAVLAIVCDGMGGEKGGNVASSVAVEQILSGIRKGYRPEMEEQSIKSLLLSAATGANAAVYDMSSKNPDLTGMGTTLTMALANDKRAHILHAGDSRVYHLSRLGIQQVTRDHSVVQMMVEKGQLTQEEARDHPQKNYITRALGVARELELEYSEVMLAPGEMLLLCSDGLTNYLREEELAQILADKRQDTPEKKVDFLVEEANRRGGSDNITAVLLMVAP